MSRSRGGAKRLDWGALREAIEAALADWEGSPFFRLKGLVDHIHDDYWGKAKISGHYGCNANAVDIRSRLLTPTGRILASLGLTSHSYNRQQSRRDRFGGLITKGIYYWALPECELPPSYINRVNSLRNLSKGRSAGYLLGEDET